MKELFDVIDTMRSPPKKKFKTGALGKWDPRLEPDVIVYNAVSSTLGSFLSSGDYHLHYFILLCNLGPTQVTINRLTNILI